LGFACLTVGCADTITYSADAQKEGETLFRKGDYANAAGAFRNSVRQNPRNYKAYYELGCAYQQLDQPQLALAAFRSARETIKLTIEGQYDKETHENILVGLAGTIASNDPRNVEADALQKEAESQQSGESWFILAKVCELRGDADSAIDAYNHAALLEPKNFTYLKNYGLYLVKLGQAQKAESPLRKAYALNDKDPEVASALKIAGGVPGPSILDENQANRPILPKNAVPGIRSTNAKSSSGSTSGNATVSAPRD
jgi:Tfp pilus assembly protein PilF